MTHSTRTLLAVLSLTVATGPLVSGQEHWPQFRGPGSTAVIPDNPDLPETWSTTENIEWAVDIPGLGWSSPVVWGDRVFLTTVTSIGDFEAPKPGLYAPRGRPEPPEVDQDWLVYCLDLASGNVVWTRSVKIGQPDFPRHMKKHVCVRNTDHRRRAGLRPVW